MKLKQHLWVCWAIAAIILTSCSAQTAPRRQQSDTKREAPLRAVTLDKTKVAIGQTVYVPV